ncbi:DUF222 domain-containing protein, partial [Actinomadura alba]
LEGPLLETGRALTEGRIDSRKARAICDGVLGIGHDIARKVEALVLPDAPRLTARQLAVRVRKAIKDADPDAYERRRRTVEKGRRVELYDNPDGTADLTARDLPAEDADAAYNYLNALANALKADGDQRPIDAIRADVLLELLRGRHPADLSPTAADPQQDPPPPAETTPEPGDTEPEDPEPEDPAPGDTAPADTEDSEPGDAGTSAAAPRGAESEAAGEPAAVAAEARASQRPIGRPGRARRTDAGRPGQTDNATGREDATGRPGRTPQTHSGRPSETDNATGHEEATGREEATG